MLVLVIICALLVAAVVVEGVLLWNTYKKFDDLEFRIELNERDINCTDEVLGNDIKVLREEATEACTELLRRVEELEKKDT